MTQEQQLIQELWYFIIHYSDKTGEELFALRKRVQAVLDAEMPKPEISGKDLSPEELEDIVHTAAAQLASEANNAGIDEQVHFLTATCGIPGHQIEAMISEEKGSQS